MPLLDLTKEQSLSLSQDGINPQEYIWDSDERNYKKKLNVIAASPIPALVAAPTAPPEPFEPPVAPRGASKEELRSFLPGLAAESARQEARAGLLSRTAASIQAANYPIIGDILSRNLPQRGEWAALPEQQRRANIPFGPPSPLEGSDFLKRVRELEAGASEAIGGAFRGGARLIEGLLTPANIAAGGAGLLSKLPLAATAIRPALSRAAALGYTTAMAPGVIQGAAETARAGLRGDIPGAIEAGLPMAVMGLGVGHLAREALRPRTVIPSEVSPGLRLAPTRETLPTPEIPPSISATGPSQEFGGPTEQAAATALRPEVLSKIGELSPRDARAAVIKELAVQDPVVQANQQAIAQAQLAKEVAGAQKRSFGEASKAANEAVREKALAMQEASKLAKAQEASDALRREALFANVPPEQAIPRLVAERQAELKAQVPPEPKQKFLGGEEVLKREAPQLTPPLKPSEALSTKPTTLAQLEAIRGEVLSKRAEQLAAPGKAFPRVPTTLGPTGPLKLAKETPPVPIIPSKESLPGIEPFIQASELARRGVISKKTPFRETPTILESKVLAPKLIEPKIKPTGEKMVSPEPSQASTSPILAGLEPSPKPLKTSAEIVEAKAKGEDISKLEAWARDKLQEGGVRTVSPDLLVAAVVRGAGLISRGVRDFSKWTGELAKEHSEVLKNIDPRELFIRSVEFHREREQKLAEPAAKAFTEEQKPAQAPVGLSSLRELQSNPTKPFGLTPDKEGAIPVQSLLSRFYQRHRGDYEYLGSDLTNFLKGKSKVGVSGLESFLTSKGPHVEVKKIYTTSGSVSAGEKTAASLRHKLETSGYTLADLIDLKRFKPEEYKKVPEDIQKLHSEWEASRPDILPSSESATEKYEQLNPKPLSEMPGAVDLLTKYRQADLGGEFPAYRTHYEKSGENLVAHSRGYEETLPDGRKAFALSEVQSDLDRYITKHPEESNAKVADKLLVQAKVWEPLALKTALKHALDTGADGVFLPDAETAMLTQRHDVAASMVKRITPEEVVRRMGNYKSISEVFGKDWKEGTYVNVEKGEFSGDWTVRVDKPESNPKGMRSSLAQELRDAGYGEKEGTYIPQEKGMRAHYDPVEGSLHNTMKKLTGYEGEEVSLGTHENSLQGFPKETRSNLIFKNPDGSPKTDITGRFYPIDKYKAELAGRKGQTLFETERPTLFDEATKQAEDRVRRGLNIRLGERRGEAGFIDLSILDDIVKAVGKGFTDFAAFSKATLMRFGAAVEPYLKPAWDKIKSPGETLARGLENISEIESIRTDAGLGPDGKVVADAAENFYAKYSDNTGTYVNNIGRELAKHITKLNPKEFFFQDTPEFREVRDFLWDKAEGKVRSESTLSTETQTILSDVVRPYFKLTRNDQNSRPGLRKGGYDENYLSQIPSKEVINTIFNAPDSLKAKAYRQDFIAYYKSKGLSEARAISDWDSWKKAWASRNINVAEQFGPIDKAIGIGIPRSMREQNLMQTILRYGDRVARRFAYHDSFETSKDVQRVMSGPNIPSAEKVKVLYNDIAGRIDPKGEQIANAITGVLNSSIVGPITGWSDYISNMTRGLKYADHPLQWGMGVVDTLAHTQRDLADSFRNGLNRANFASFEFGDGGLGTTVQMLQTLRNASYKVWTRDIAERLSRANALGLGKYYAMSFFEQARKGALGAQGKSFFKQFDPDGEYKSYLVAGQLTPEYLSNVGKRFGEHHQGTYDPREQPRWTREGQFSSFARLMRWPIGQLPRFAQSVVRPALEGNYLPLVYTTLGTVLGGTAVQEFRHLLTRRSSKVPAFKELLDTYNETDKAKAIEGLTYKMATLADLAGETGLIANLVRGAGTFVFKDSPQTFNNVIVQAASNMWGLGQDWYDAVENGDTPKFVDVLSRILEENAQGYRVLLAQLSESQKTEIERANKLRDLHVFKSLSGYPVVRPELSRNVFRGGPEREFKEGETKPTPDDVANLIARAAQRSRGDPYKFMRDINSLKSGGIQTFPSLETNPIEAAKYYQFLTRTQGKEEALSRFTDYVKAKMRGVERKTMLDTTLGLKTP